MAKTTTPKTTPRDQNVDPRLEEILKRMADGEDVDDVLSDVLQQQPPLSTGPVELTHG